jgi:hypothetical protein
MSLGVQIGLLLVAQAANTEPAAAPAAPFTASACPRNRAPPDDITVCGRHDPGNGYRLPPAPEGFDPGGTIDSVSRERHRMLDVGAVGTQSCSAVGPGGWTGCEFNDWRHADEQWAGRNHGHWPRATLHVGAVNPPPR